MDHGISTKVHCRIKHVVSASKSEALLLIWADEVRRYGYTALGNNDVTLAGATRTAEEIAGGANLLAEIMCVPCTKKLLVASLGTELNIVASAQVEVSGVGVPDILLMYTDSTLDDPSRAVGSDAFLISE
jgi:hypothetical protein